MDSKISEKLADMVVSFYKSDRRWTILKRSALAFAFIVGITITITNFINTYGRWPVFGDYAAVVNIKGVMEDGGNASADNIIPSLKLAFEDEHAKAVFLQIDSPGGSPLEAERIYSVLDYLKSKHKKPVIAVINNTGASAAYLVAIHADKIVAGKYSLVGSIGMIISTYNVSGLAERFHVEKYSFTSGPLKSFLDPLTPATPAVRKKAQEMVRVGAALFIEEVKLRRAGKLKAGYDFFTGETWLGSEALRLGLIDEIGTLEEVARAYNLPATGVGSGSGLYAKAGISDRLTATLTEKLAALLFLPKIN